MKVLLVYPGISGIGFASYGRGMEESWASHGLCLLSAAARKKGHDICLLDLRRISGWNECAERLAKVSPDVVGITMMSVDYNPAMTAAGLVRRVVPSARVVVGGAHPTICTPELEGDARLDHIVVGEGELAFPEILRALEAGEKVDRVIRGARPDLDELPFADRELFGGTEHPLPVPGFSPPFVTVIAGRGCVYNCSFCQPAERLMFGKSVRRRSPANVISELEELRDRWNFRSLMLHDDCLTEDKAWCLEFAARFRQSGFKQPFACQSRADLICRGEDVIQALSDVGLKLMFVGFESGNQRVLNFLRKGTKVEHNFQAARILRKHRVAIWANYMMGVPTETKEEVRDTVRMLRAIAPEHHSPAFFTPHPGSALFSYCEEHRLSLIRSHDSFRRNPTEAKIRGVDYDFLQWAVLESMGQNLPFIPASWLNALKRRVAPFFQRHPVLGRWSETVVKRIAQATRTRTNDVRTGPL
ncbi:MAG: B12-binding domain-containing radical SAM protein [Myxococcaceae bacterium]